MDLENFIHNTKLMVLQLSSSYNPFMSIKQIQYLNHCLNALEMISVMFLNKGNLVP